MLPASHQVWRDGNSQEEGTEVPGIAKRDPWRARGKQCFAISETATRRAAPCVPLPLRAQHPNPKHQQHQR